MRPANKEALNRMAREVHRHGNVRIGKANVDPHVKIGFYIGPGLRMDTKTKSEMYFYLLGCIRGKRHDT